MGTPLLLMLLGGLPAHAQAPGEVALDALTLCRKVEEAEARLECYDAAVRDTPIAVDEGGLTRNTAVVSVGGVPDAFRPAISTLGKWMMFREVDAYTQLPVLTAMLPADSGVGRHGAPVELAVRCDRGELLAYVEWGAELPRGVEVTTILGSGEPTVQPWGLPDARDATFAPGDVHALLAKVAAHDTLVLSVQPSDRGPEITALFDVRRFQRLWGELSAACPVR